LIPLVASLIAIRAKGLRAVVAGLAMGFAGFLAYAAWAKAPPLAYMPFTFLALPWLLVNALICLLIARAMLRKEGAR
ncbi:MAG TPA: peptidase S8, partial [Myxococcaceae bacterium]|nr:peptidase S8 [Myxococcaceae bacterium]